jgi:hypothetical protein
MITPTHDPGAEPLFKTSRFESWQVRFPSTHVKPAHFAMPWHRRQQSP